MKWVLAAVSAAILVGTGAEASSITMTSFTKTDYDNALGQVGQVLAVEDFESYTGLTGANSGGANGLNIVDGFSTNVGTVSSNGGTGSGGTVTGGGSFAGNDGSMLALRDGNVFGRTSTTATLTGDRTDDQFLDSNDTYGLTLNASLGGTMFNRILLTLTDATDVGATMTITAAGQTLVFSGLGNANQQIILIDFGASVANAVISFANTKGGNSVINDGFSIDDIVVGQVPLPAPALLLIGGIGALGALRRRKRG